MRWTTKTTLLPDRDLFTTLDLVRAAMFDELNTLLKPARASRVWRRIRDDIGLPGTRLEVVVNLATCEAKVCRTDDELLAALTRRTTIVVLPLHDRAERALHRLREFRAGASTVESAGPAAEVSSLKGREAAPT